MPNQPCHCRCKTLPSTVSCFAWVVPPFSSFLLQLQWLIAICFYATLAQLGSFHVSSFWWLRWSKRCLGRTTDRIGRANALLSLSVRRAALLPSSLSLSVSLSYSVNGMEEGFGAVLFFLRRLTVDVQLCNCASTVPSTVPYFFIRACGQSGEDVHEAHDFLPPLCSPPPVLASGSHAKIFIFPLSLLMSPQSSFPFQKNLHCFSNGLALAPSPILFPLLQAAASHLPLRFSSPYWAGAWDLLWIHTWVAGR
jgi:hypothetical protein